MTERPPSFFLKKEEIHALAARAITVLEDTCEGYWEETDSDERLKYSHWIRTAVDALRFCAGQAALDRDVSFLTLMADAIHWANFYDDPYSISGGDTANLFSSLSQLLEDGPMLPESLCDLCYHRSGRIRAGMASALRPVGEKEISLLEDLAVDTDANVRKEAQHSLSQVREIPWWEGKFSQDPARALSPEEATRLKPVFETISSLLDQKFFSEEDARALAAQAKELPDEPLFDLVRTNLPEYNCVKKLYPLLGVMFQREGAFDVLLSLFKVWEDERWPQEIGALAGREMDALPGDVRLTFCHKLLEYIAQVDPEARTKGTENPSLIAAAIIEKAWPKDTDLTPLLDFILAQEKPVHQEYDHTLNTLAKTLTHQEREITAILPRVLEAHLSGYPGSWERLQSYAPQILQRAPKEMLRPAAQKAIQSEDEKLLRWGLEYLLGPLHDPEQDPPRDTLITSFLKEPRYRKAIFYSYPLEKLLLPYLRQELNSSSLTLPEAAHVMGLISRYHGGLVDLWEYEFLLQRANKEKQAKSSDAPRNPISEEEWQIFRRLRDAHDFNDPDHQRIWWEIVFLFPKGPDWHPEDRAFLPKMIQACRDGKADNASMIARLLKAKPRQEDLPLFDELLTYCTEDEERKQIRQEKKKALKKLGLLSKGGQQKTDIPEASREWMDEEEEDDEE